MLRLSLASILIAVNSVSFAHAEPTARKYEALDFKDQKCEIVLSILPGDKGVFCGKLISRQEVLRSTSIETRRCDGWGRYCSAEIFRHAIIYKQQQDDAKATLAFYFLNKGVSDRFIEEFASWLENTQPEPMPWEKGL